MRTRLALAATAALALAASGCERATSIVAPDATASAVTAVTPTPKGTFFSFTKLPFFAVSDVMMAAAPRTDLLTFSMVTTETKAITINRFSFMITGSLPVGALTNFELTWYPKGLKKPGIVVATNDGAAWVPGPTPADFLNLDFTTPLLLDKKVEGVFVLRGDVNGTTRYLFQPRLQTANIGIGGVDQLMLDTTCDLPLAGDVFFIN